MYVFPEILLFILVFITFTLFIGFVAVIMIAPMLFVVIIGVGICLLDDIDVTSAGEGALSSCWSWSVARRI